MLEQRKLSHKTLLDLKCFAKTKKSHFKKNEYTQKMSGKNKILTILCKGYF